LVSQTLDMGVTDFGYGCHRLWIWVSPTLDVGVTDFAHGCHLLWMDTLQDCELTSQSLTVFLSLIQDICLRLSLDIGVTDFGYGCHRLCTWVSPTLHVGVTDFEWTIC